MVGQQAINKPIVAGENVNIQSWGRELRQ